MTISSPVARRSPPYPGNGSANEFDFDFLIRAEEDIDVPLLNTDTLELIYLELDVDFEVTGAGDKDGGTIILIDAGQDWIDSGNLAEDFTIQILGKTPRTQRASIRNQGNNFDPATFEDSLDKATMIDQEQQEEIDRCLQLPAHVTPEEFDPTLPNDIVGASEMIPITNAAGNKLDDVANWIPRPQLEAAIAAGDASAQAVTDAQAAVTAAQAAQAAAETARDVALAAQAAAEAAAGAPAINSTDDGTITGDLDGSNTSFVLDDEAAPLTEIVTVGTQTLTPNLHYVLTGNDLELFDPPEPDQPVTVRMRKVS